MVLVEIKSATPEYFLPLPAFKTREVTAILDFHTLGFWHFELQARAKNGIFHILVASKLIDGMHRYH